MGGIFFKRKCRGSNFVLQFSNSIAWFCLYKIKKSVVYFYQNLAHSESYNGYNGHSGAFLRRRFLVPTSATSSCMYLLDLDSACVSILMPLMSRHCLTLVMIFYSQHLKIRTTKRCKTKSLKGTLPERNEKCNIMPDWKVKYDIQKYYTQILI